MRDPSRNLSFWAIWNMSFGFLGIQFGWGLQMANMSAIYQYLGASESQLPILWLAAPVTGLIVQPIIGHYSDRTWTRLGRRRPYFLAGAILASLALLVMPNCKAVWMAAMALWVLDASVNVSMEPFRAFIGDLMPPGQRKIGFAMQSFFIGLGAVLSNALPWLFRHMGVASDSAPGVIPQSIRLSFYVGSVVYLASVLYTIVTTKEPPPEAGDSAGPTTGFGEIVTGVLRMPQAMRRLAFVQFFTWLALFCMWLYFTPVIAHRYFGVPGTDAYTRGVEWGGLCFALYNLVATVYSFALIGLGKAGVPAKTLYRVGLLCAAFGLLTVGVWSSAYLLLISMLGVGIGWATILSMPYSLLANTIPAGQMGYFMGVFNFFVVLPQIVASALLGPVVSRFLHGSGLGAVVAGGFFFLVAAVGLHWVPAREGANAS